MWVSWSARPDNPLSRAQILSCESSKVGLLIRLAGVRLVLHQIRATFAAAEALHH